MKTWFKAVLCTAVLAALPAQAALSPLAPIQVKGDFVVTGNCMNDRRIPAVPVDVDGDPSTKSSASANLSGALGTIKQATLYWHSYVPTAPTIKFKTPADSAYVSYTGTVAAQAGLATLLKVDLTSKIGGMTDAQRNSTYWGADIPALPNNASDTCWSLFVVYDNGGPLREVQFYEGLDWLQGSGNLTTTIALPGNQATPRSVNLGFFSVNGQMASETNPPNTGHLYWDGTSLIRNAPGCSATDFWCGNGGPFGQNPAPSTIAFDTTGYTGDIDKIAIPAALIPAGPANVALRYDTDNQDYLIVEVFAVSTQLYEPPPPPVAVAPVPVGGLVPWLLLSLGAGVMAWRRRRA